MRYKTACMYPWRENIQISPSVDVAFALVVQQPCLGSSQKRKRTVQTSFQAQHEKASDYVVFAFRIWQSRASGKHMHQQKFTMLQTY
jgi:hypothetical protein